MDIWMLWLLLFISPLWTVQGGFNWHRRLDRSLIGQNARLARMPVVAYWTALRHQVNGDGMDLKWLTGVNSYSMTQQALGGDEQIVEGDVCLSERTSRPVMEEPAIRGEMMYLRDWLQQLGPTNKTLKLNLMNDRVVKPSFKYLSSALHQGTIASPVVVHANVWKGPNAYYEPVLNVRSFLRLSEEHFPDCTVSLGHTYPGRREQLAELRPIDFRISWRQVFDMLDRTYDLRQPVVFRIATSSVEHSYQQLLWLLGVRSSFSLLIWRQQAHLQIDAWTGLTMLRKYAERSNILYDVPSADMAVMGQKYNELHDQVPSNVTAWRRNDWRVVEFLNTNALLSTVVASSYGPAFVGWPTAFLLSERAPNDRRFEQQISGHLLFVPKRNYKDVHLLDDTGLSIYLVDTLAYVPSPNIQGGIHIFIGFSGRVSIQNRDFPHSTNNGHSFYAPLFAKAVSELSQHDCYGFRILDAGDRVRLSVRPSDGCFGTAHSRHRALRTYTSRTLQIRTRVPATGRQRYVLMQKSGDAVVDVLVNDLLHANTARRLAGGMVLMVVLAALVL